MSRAIGISDFLAKEFNVYSFEDKFLNSFGEPETNFSALVYGHPKNGKTEFCIQLAKYMSQYTRVYYNSYEQGISKSLQDALKRNKMEDVSGKVIFGNKETYSEMIDRLSKKNSPMVCFIDSRDYMNLTAAQWFRLIEKFPRKAFIAKMQTAFQTLDTPVATETTTSGTVAADANTKADDAKESDEQQ